MRTAFRAEQLTDPHMKDAEKALRTCVHCGFCTATCPTYLLLGDERDGPRGRIVLMQHMLESDAPPTPETVKHLDRCLSCLGCKTACPSGVDYSALIDKARAHIETHYTRPFSERVFRAFILFVLTRPTLFAGLAGVSRLFGPILSRLPGRLGAMSRKARVGGRKRVDRSVPQVSASAPRVLLLPGCVQRALAPEIDAAATRVLAREDVRVERLDHTGMLRRAGLSSGQGGERKGLRAKHHSRVRRRSGERALEAVLITASGCSAFLKDYGRVFADEPEWKARAETFAAKVKDFTELARPRSFARGNRRLCARHRVPSALYAAAWAKDLRTGRGAVGGSRISSGADSRRASVLRFGGELQPAAARDRRSIAGAQARRHTLDRRGDHRVGEYRVFDASVGRTADGPHRRIARLGRRGTEAGLNRLRRQSAP